VNETIIVDTGPLVAYLDKRDTFHDWAKAQMREFTEPLISCEAVIAEALFLLRRGRIDPQLLLQLVERGIVVISIRLDDEIAALRKLIARYRGVPMALADACLVRLSEIHERCVVWTIDSDFTIYRRNGRRPIPLLMPPESD
jgi:uncharacterized protein